MIELQSVTLTYWMISCVHRQKSCSRTRQRTTSALRKGNNFPSHSVYFVIKFSLQLSFSPGEVDAALKALEDEKCNLDAACVKAAVLEAKAHAPLSGKERLRIPIVLIKMDSGKVLCAEDAKIWDAVSRSLKTDADIKRATDVTVKTRTTHAQLVAKKAAKKPLKCFRQVVDAARTHHQQLDLTTVHGARTREKMEFSGRRASSPRNQKSNETSARNPAEASSSRIHAGTAASQARADCNAEDNLPAVKGNHKKQPKRGNNSKRSLRVSSRPEPCDDPQSANEPRASTEADTSDTMETASSLVEIGENARASFVSQVASLSTIVAATFSSKNNPFFAGNNLSNERSKKMTEQLPTESVAATSYDTIDIDAISRHSSLKPDPIAASSTNEESLCAGGVEPPVVPAKRRSYFGTLLATLLRGDSAQGGVFARTNSSGSLPNADNAANPSQEPVLSKKPAGLTSWLPWRSFGKNTAVAAA